MEAKDRFENYPIWMAALLLALLFLMVLSTTGNAFIRGTFACQYCKQRDLGCPAEQLFNKK